MGTEYFIVGDTNEFEDCLACVCGNNLKRAEDTLYRFLNNPTKDDSKLINGYKNLRIKEDKSENCWWKNGCD